MKSVLLPGLLLSVMLGTGACTSAPATVPITPATPVPTTAMSASAAATSVYDFTLNDINGQPVSLGQYRGKKLLLVNTASECGYTPQYKELEELSRQYSGQITVLGFPANNFGGQEPGSDAQIASFCEKNFGVTFPLFSKISVAGPDAAPLYQYLGSKAQNGATDEKPNWNFCKYLIDETGHVVAFYPSKVNPLSEELLSAIRK
ncbi:glutathione peroxidase [Hymenobacter actinosclerus]|uniref:Glutathione peroxidase n=1 Tax=Hymenobacter actinosclerus TaxID=82805 RepID=A0A1I0FPV9_9BACT|nr:glutathione peroxidase [Hymenobacter actinosclerus]SET59558.1 glutathione peroxidase [Hymenobacter actinosclerus]